MNNIKKVKDHKIKLVWGVILVVFGILAVLFAIYTLINMHEISSQIEMMSKMGGAHAEGMKEMMHQHASHSNIKTIFILILGGLAALMGFKLIAQAKERN